MYLLKLYNNQYCFFIILLIVSFTLYAQRQDIIFRNIGVEQDLSQGSANSIVQDEKGFIWIATEDGLNKYDGYGFTVYKPVLNDTESISNNNIWSLYYDAGGMLWIGTFDGLNRFDLKTEKFKRFLADSANPSALSHPLVRVVYGDREGDLWIGTSGGGLDKFDRSKESFVHHQYSASNPASLSSNIVFSLFEDSSGTLWVGTDNGLNRFDRKNNSFIHYVNIPGDPFSLSNNMVYAIYEDRSGMLWIGTADGLNIFDRSEKKFTHFHAQPDNPASLSNSDIRVIYEDIRGVLWIGTDYGLNKFIRESRTFIQCKHDPNNPASLGKRGVRSIYEDRSGVMWIGTWGTGLNLFERERKKFEHYKNIPFTDNCLSYNDVLALYEDKEGMLWIGTYGGGLNRFDRRRGIFTHYRNDPANPHSLSNDRVRSINEDNAGALWICTWGGGLNKYDRKKESFTCYRHNPKDSNSLGADIIRSICKDSEGILWLGTEGGGVNRFDPTTGISTRYPHDPDNPNSISSNRIFDIKESRSGNLWVATYGGGLNKFDRKTGKCTLYRHNPKNPNSLSYDYLSPLYEDKNGIVWIGSDGKGLNRFDPRSNTFKIYNEAQGLASSVIYAILEDDHGNLWMSHNKGIARFDPESETFRNYTTRDGIQSNEFNGLSYFKSPRTGEMFFGGVNGFNIFHPDSIKENPYPPSVVITAFHLFNKPVPIGIMADGRLILEKSITMTDTIILSHTDNVFSFEFAALHYGAPEKNRYAYTMEGFEKNWNYSMNRHYVTYTNLDPGTYTFKVKGSNCDGVWNEKGASIKIIIVPPFWKTWWFYILLYLAIILAAAAGYIIQIDRLRRKKEAEEQLKAITDVNQVVEQGTAVAYRRKVNSNEYEFMGEGITKITGYSPREITLDTLNRLILKKETGGDLSHLTQKEVFDLVRKGTLDRWVTDYKISTKSGEIRWVRDMITVLRDKSGQSDTLLGIIFDITDRKQAEQKLALTSVELKEKNKVMEEDLNMAREIQTSFLSKYLTCFPPGTSRENCQAEFSHVYLPALKLAGDFFDVIPISDHEVGVLICDVIGHGARASLLAFYLRGLIAELMPVAQDPGSFMGKLNTGLNALSTQFSSSIFATAFYLVADIKSGTLRYTTAGHPMPFILRRSQGIVEMLPSNDATSGSAIGLHKEYTFATFTASIASGDTLFFFTDGVYEVWNAEDQMFGLERLHNSLQNNLSIPDNELLNKVINEILQFTTTNVLNDDICLVGMHVRKIK